MKTREALQRILAMPAEGKDKKVVTETFSQPDTSSSRKASCSSGTRYP